MTRVLIDTSCLVAAALPQHQHHATTIAELMRRRHAGHVFVMAAHAVTEAYAVLTRLPPPHRLSPADAVVLLDRNWGSCETVALTATETWRVLRQHAAGGLAGGRVYDGVIAACAKKGKASQLLTWNARHFAGAAAVTAITPAT